MNLKSRFMKRAILLARRGKGLTAPNPCVGAVVVKGGIIIGEGWHKGYGLEHAEVNAINDAKIKGYDVTEAELFVTLEPCNHFGKTPPCTDFILKHKIRKVYVGCEDPNPNVRGGGIRYLVSKGVEVECDVLKNECKELIEDFLVWINEKRPYVYLKLASTLDGKIADRYGNSSWITNEKSRNFVQKIRSLVDCILIGTNTLYTDDPKLTCRLKKRRKKRQPLAIIPSSKIPSRSLKELYLFKERLKDLIFFLPDNISYKEVKPWVNMGLKIYLVKSDNNGFPLLKEILDILYTAHNCYYLLCEGGGKIACSIVEQGFVDELILFFAPKVLGDEMGKCSFNGRGDVTLDKVFEFSIKRIRWFGDDVAIFFKPLKSKNFN